MDTHLQQSRHAVTTPMAQHPTSRKKHAQYMLVMQCTECSQQVQRKVRQRLAWCTTCRPVGHSISMLNLLLLYFANVLFSCDWGRSLPVNGVGAEPIFAARCLKRRSTRADVAPLVLDVAAAADGILLH